MDSDEDIHMSDNEPLNTLSKGKGKAIDTGAHDSESLPWWGLSSLCWDCSDGYRVEKYRPVTLDDVVSHKDITSTSKSPAHFNLSSLTRSLSSRKVYWKEPVTSPIVLRTPWDWKNFHYSCCSQANLRCWLQETDSWSMLQDLIANRKRIWHTLSLMLLTIVE